MPPATLWRVRRVLVYRGKPGSEGAGGRYRRKPGPSGGGEGHVGLHTRKPWRYVGVTVTKELYGKAYRNG